MLWLCVVAALDQDIEALRQRTAELEPRVQLLQGSYLKTEAFDREATIKQRIDDGETLHLLGDHARASVLLFDVVSDARNAEHPDYDRALYYLAESSYIARNIAGARQWFRELITRGRDEHLFDAFERLVQISDRLQDHSGVESAVEELKRSGLGKLRADVAYLYGKSLSRRGQSERALSVLETVPAAHKYHHRARYVIGAEHALAGRFDEAVRCFEGIARAAHPLGEGAPEADVARFRELAELAKARVYAELGKLDEAMSGYAAVAKDSPRLPDALYEIAWMQVQAGAYRRALQAIDILLLTRNDRTLAPRAQLLKGNVLIKLGRMNDALDTFDRVGATYEPVYRELTATLASQRDPEAYFNEIIAKNQGVYNASAFLPPLAVAWVSDEQEVGRALGVANDLRGGERDIAEARSIAQRIVATIATKPEAGLFALFSEGDKRASDAERDLRSALETLLVLSTRAAGAKNDRASARAKEERLQAQAALLDARARHETISAQDGMRRAAGLILESELARVRTELTGMRARLAALQPLLTKKAALREQAANEARAVEELERLQHEAERELGALRAQLQPKTESERLQSAYDDALARELAISSLKAGRNPALGELRDRLGAADAGLRAFRMRLRGVVDAQTAQIASRVEAELAQLAADEAELAEVKRSAASLVGGIALHSFEGVRKKLYDLVLKADVGLIDVVWKEKDERTETINTLVKAQKEAVNALDHDFEELFAKERM